MTHKISLLFFSLGQNYALMEIITCIISGFAFIISVAAYYVNLKLPNQNKIFDEKIRAYGEIATAIDNAVLALSDGIGIGKYLRKDKPKGYTEELDDLADNIDETINILFDVLMANIIILPKNVYEHLDGVATFIDSEENYNIFENPKRIDSLLEELRKNQNDAIRVMRNDLQSDQLNNGLRKRLVGNIGHKIFGSE